jgi:DNA-3-methyladenine glycosylase II
MRAGRIAQIRVERSPVTCSSLLMADHYGWVADPTEAVVRRAFRAGERTWSITSAIEMPLLPSHGGLGEPASWSLDLDALSEGALSGGLQVHRVATPSVWEALATGVLRQVVRASTARRRYTRLVATAANDGAFPSPDQVLRCDEREVAVLGLRFCWPKLVVLARWAAEVGAADGHMSADRDVLLEDAASLSGLGPWTLGVAAWDCSNDSERYPFGDYVVQAGAARMFPDVDWPRRPDRFAPAWSARCDDDLGPLTVLALLAADDRVWSMLTAQRASLLVAPR